MRLSNLPMMQIKPPKERSAEHVGFRDAGGAWNRCCSIVMTTLNRFNDRLQEEMPAKGYPSITPRGNESPIVSFSVDDPESIMDKLRRADIHVAMRFGNKMRISPSVFNTQQDIDRLLAALA